MELFITTPCCKGFIQYNSPVARDLFSTTHCCKGVIRHFPSVARDFFRNTRCCKGVIQHHLLFQWGFSTLLAAIKELLTNTAGLPEGAPLVWVLERELGMPRIKLFLLNLKIIFI
jgi:hypothetical protein